ncbi:MULTISPECIES: Rrf2 family transcriptional regulator [unclassified Breznakia]|uniref:RrF2 family transcriptional regulator n=1 Tax=unclassified Breznakia TaxID=2623764 RepID=UPI0024741BDF|nr:MULTISPECIES: Rrf2 family transcriptional regulator [unclassified Breznakia]MDH6366398.1 Rrf2 family iron-sulfur cluster assembly transcriptional regulator [Breznakia sp. PH1-1]MDH6403491.1 Rrf2 family iron-sulfur cluster assembly transcriptional regulator [Breznakia sp. PF1-11]MDH6411200.1 Rrf2 family iron-sulfur cluster assembly transcriptional regulator [Breznakia sp. PFB1-11]MDH6413537.1 Rrf2 family iron-sulfur cluster assembly transcriptional regulator [Breznakia sp. PFB1-14]MDH6415745
MKISKRGVYAVECLVYLANEEKSMSIADIANKRNCSAKFLEHIFRDLKSANILISKRGKTGGYMLARPTSEISCKDIVLAVEQNLEIVHCVTGYCAQEDQCMTSNLWKKTQDQLYRSLENITIKSLVDSYREGVSHETNYQI